MTKIAIIGPAYPYRGGISHHTNHLVNALIKKGETVILFTFSRQYPSKLYPGENQIEPKGTSNPLPKSSFFSIFSLLDTLNPFSWYKTAHNIVKERPQYVLVKYWHPYFVPCFTFIAWLLRRKKIPVICIVDNLFPHEPYWGSVFLVKFLFSQINASITQSQIVHEQFVKIFPHVPETLLMHPVYDQFGLPIGPKDARLSLGVPFDKKILLFFGFIRPYKGLDSLLLIMPKLISKYPNIHLIVAGECFGSFMKYQNIIDRLNLQNFLTLRLKYIKNSEIPFYFGACDLLVLPYKSITNSGIENIGKIYSTDSLITVGLSGQELFSQIDKKLSSPTHLGEKKMKWPEYADKLVYFLQNIS